MGLEFGGTLFDGGANRDANLKFIARQFINSPHALAKEDAQCVFFGLEIGRFGVRLGIQGDLGGDDFPVAALAASLTISTAAYTLVFSGDCPR